MSKLNQKKRDVAWSWALLRNPRIGNIINWAWNRTSEIDARGLLPTALILSWCLSSSSKEIRDKATRALSCVLLRKPEIATDLIEKLLPVGDDYISERLFAAIYGAASNSHDAKKWLDAVSSAYRFTYEGGETYPNIMVRNYTDCLVDNVAGRLGLEKDYTLAHSRGNSGWYDYTPSNEDIDRLMEQVKNAYGDRSLEYGNLWWLVHSMTTEYGRGTCNYGDFGRYVFGSHVSPWNNQFDDGDLSNMALGEILQSWYDIDLDTPFDRRVNYYEEGANRGFERITKKYQWISMFRLIARLLDNFPPFHEEHTYDDEYNAYCDRRSELFLEWLCNWSENAPEDRQNPDGDGSGDSVGILPDSFSPREMLPEDHIISTARIPIDAPELFNGLSSLRDIDPTVLHPSVNLTDTQSSAMSKMLLDLSGDVVYDETSVGEVLDTTRIVEINGVRYVPLSIVSSLDTYSTSGAQVFLDTACGFVARDQADAFLRNYKGRDNSGLFPIESDCVYQYEFYGSYSYTLWRTFIDSERSDEEQIASVATTNYAWESSNDLSMGAEVLRFSNPSRELVSYLNLKQNECGVWTNGKDEVVCRNESSMVGRQFVIREDCLLDYLESNDLLLCRGEYFEVTWHHNRQRIWITSIRNDDGTNRYRLSNCERFHLDRRRFA